MKSPSHPESLDSFYHLSAWPDVPSSCRGTACVVARGPGQIDEGETRIHCMGKCYAAPAERDDTSRPHIEVRSREAVLCGNLADGGARTLERYRERGGYTALGRALETEPAALVESVLAAGLRGRGGAGFPTGLKMRSVLAQPGLEKYIVANADEGDPGSFVDRFLMEDDPHRLLEAMAIASHAVGAHQGYIYVRREYPEALAILQEAVEEARAAGLLGSGSAFDITPAQGHGSYVCGEETALIASLEGRRPEVAPRPPFPTERGLFGKPTLLLNVETLCNLPWIVAHGAERYAALGYARSRGTKVVALNSLVKRPGLYEVEFGMPLGEIIDDLGGGMKEGTLKGVFPSGPLGGVISAACLDVPLDFEALRELGVSVGHGGMVVFGHDMPLRELLHHVFSFAAYESCGKCTPCRLGTRKLERALDGGAPLDREAWDDLIDALAETSLCGHGYGVADTARSAARHFPEELHSCLA